MKEEQGWAGSRTKGAATRARDENSEPAIFLSSYFLGLIGLFCLATRFMTWTALAGIHQKKEKHDESLRGVGKFPHDDGKNGS